MRWSLVAVALTVGLIVVVTAGFELWFMRREVDIYELPWRGLYLIVNTSPISYLVLLLVALTAAAVGARRAARVV